MTRVVYARIHVASMIFCSSIVFRVLTGVVFIGFTVRVSQIDPQRAGTFQYPTTLGEYFYQMLDIVFPDGFISPLSEPTAAMYAVSVDVRFVAAFRMFVSPYRRYVIIPHQPVRRRGNDTIHCIVRQQTKTR